MSDIRYPIGKFSFDENVKETEKQQFINEIADTPAKLRSAVTGLTPAQLDTAYRPDGWTVRQVVHHLADSHMNSYIRFKLAMTEDEPVIKTYAEDQWAELADARSGSIDLSLTLLEVLHERWVLFLKSLKPADYQRKFRHPELGVVSLNKSLALYAWHGKHHIAHITTLREKERWD
ncbi:MAG: YfiT family bacillithiol transferase [Acidobacteriota bacterium]